MLSGFFPLGHQAFSFPGKGRFPDDLHDPYHPVDFLKSLDEAPGCQRIKGVPVNTPINGAHMGKQTGGHPGDVQVFCQGIHNLLFHIVHNLLYLLVRPGLV